MQKPKTFHNILGGKKSVFGVSKETEKGTIFCKIMLQKFSLSTILLSILLVFFSFVGHAQKRRPLARNQVSKSQKQPRSLSTTKYRTPVSAVVIEERLAILRFEPSLAAIPMQRMRAGRSVLITGERQADGVTFFRVNLPPEKSGWIQSEAVATNAKSGDDARLAALIRVSDGFDKLELATIFLENFLKSSFRPAILMLTGDLAEEAAQKLSGDALRKLSADEIAASGAPIHSFYLNFNELDRYRKIGISFLFNQSAKSFHYNGAVWQEVLQKNPDAAEAAEARKRLEFLALQMK